MLKRIKNNITIIRKSEYDECTPYLDCTAHDAAQAALDAAQAALETAQTNLENAQKLKADLEKEKANASELLGNYKNVYDTMMSTGSSIANPNNMGDLSSVIKCVSDYGESVEASYNEAVSEEQRCSDEVDRCTQEVQQAAATLAATPCVWKCD